MSATSLAKIASYLARQLKLFNWIRDINLNGGDGQNTKREKETSSLYKHLEQCDDRVRRIRALRGEIFVCLRNVICANEICTAISVRMRASKRPRSLQAPTVNWKVQHDDAGLIPRLSEKSPTCAGLRCGSRFRLIHVERNSNRRGAR